MSQRGVVLYLELHQPYRVRPYSVFDTAQSHDYFTGDGGTEWDNWAMFDKVARNSYRPMLELIEKLLARHQDFKLSLSMTGTFLEQAETWAPDIIQQVRRLVATNRVELLAETYHHTLAFFYSPTEFTAQVKLHQTTLERLFDYTPRVIRGTELAYNDSFADWAYQNGYKAVLAEGWDPVLDWRSPNLIYRAAGTDLPLLLKNYRLSDDVAFRFSDKSWKGWPLTPEKYASWIDQSLGDQQVTNLFMDFETFGEHQWRGSGIFEFFEQFIDIWLNDTDGTFYTVSGATAAHQPVSELSIPHTLTWADSGRDLSAWSGNRLQQSALSYVYSLEEDILRTNNQALIDDWRKLQTSDHFYYMCTKGFADGEVHDYFSPYSSPYDGFLYYLNAIRDIRWRIFANRSKRSD